jgi:DNA-binding transcriptional LysR family regulator
MSLTIRGLTQVIAVARCGSLSRAADELNITQPALSRTVNQIEERYGVQIFERTRTGMSLTPAGCEIVEEIKFIVRDVENLERGMRFRGKGELGIISYGVTPMLAKIILPHAGAQSLNQRPDVCSRVTIEQASALLEDLIWDRLEFVVCPIIGFSQFDELDFEMIGRFQSMHYVRADHPLTSRGRLRMEDMLGFPVVAPVEVSNQAHANGAGDFICDNYDILRHLALTSDAILFSGTNLTAQDIENGTLQKLEFEDFEYYDNEIFIVRRRGRSVSALATFVCNQIVAAFAAATAPERVAPLNLAAGALR